MEEMIVDNGGGRQERVRIDYPGNSKKARTEGEDKPKVASVVEGTVVQRKKGPIARVREAFLVEDSSSVLVYLVQEVLVPAAKNTILEVFSQGLERSLYGETRRTPARSGGYTAYHKARDTYSDRRDLSRQARATHDFREVVLQSRADAEAVIDGLRELADQYGTTSVQDFYDLTEITGDYVDNKWGWTYEEVSRARVRVIRGGYLVDLPRPRPI